MKRFFLFIIKRILIANAACLVASCSIFPHEILASSNYLEEVKQGLSQLHDKDVLILWGDADTGFKTAERERFERIFPQHKTVILKGAKHFVQEDAPEEICKAILAFENNPPESLTII